ncbi:MAG: hypothetical protein J0M34_01355 [Alphaproteobacteria bacterium]|nr:hypothetical protein [Alphaproteobacteria bacterium]
MKALALHRPRALHLILIATALAFLAVSMPQPAQAFNLGGITKSFSKSPGAKVAKATSPSRNLLSRASNVTRSAIKSTRSVSSRALGALRGATSARKPAGGAPTSPLASATGGSSRNAIGSRIGRSIGNQVRQQVSQRATSAGRGLVQSAVNRVTDQGSRNVVRSRTPVVNSRSAIASRQGGFGGGAVVPAVAGLAGMQAMDGGGSIGGKPAAGPQVLPARPDKGVLAGKPAPVTPQVLPGVPTLVGSTNGGEVSTSAAPPVIPAPPSAEQLAAAEAAKQKQMADASLFGNGGPGSHVDCVFNCEQWDTGNTAKQNLQYEAR